MYSGWNYHIIRYKNHLDQETKTWEKIKFAQVKAAGMVLYRNIWNSFDAVFAFDEVKLTLIWAEDRYGKPGIWQIRNHVRNSFD